MTKKQWVWMLVMVVLSGFAGGAVMSWLVITQPVQAQKKSGPAEVLAAQEFRLVDGSGKTGARITLRDQNVLAEIPDLSRWTIKVLQQTTEK